MALTRVGSKGLAPGAVDPNDIAANAIIEAKIADGAVTPNKISGEVPVTKGGTGVASLTANAILLGNGTSAVATVSAGTTGNVLTSDGNVWISQAIVSGGNYVLEAYTSPATWTKPDGLKAVKVTVVGGGGGGGGGAAAASGGGGGGAGVSIKYISAPSIPGPVTVTAGAGGASSTSGGTSSFGPFLSATGGGAGALAPGAAGAGGAGTDGQLNIPGGAGAAGLNITSISGGGGGAGGTIAKISSISPDNSFVLFSGLAGGGAWGRGGEGVTTPNTNGNPGIGFGNGGSGARASLPSSRTGGTGATGVVIVEEFY